MKYKFIGCEIFKKPVYMAAEASKHDIDIEFTKVSAHSSPGDLREKIQSAIDKADSIYDGVLLGYGLCGNSTVNLMSRSVPLIIPRAHDCCTVFLGSRSSFLKHFAMTPSAEWRTACHYECSKDLEQGFCDYEKLIEKYGEDNAQYIRQNLAGETSVDFLTFINLPGIENNDALNAFLEEAKKRGKSTRFIEGDLRLIWKLLVADINHDEFLVVQPGSVIKPVYDQEEIMRAST
jgi:hypothetical protein